MNFREAAGTATSRVACVCGGVGSSCAAASGERRKGAGCRSALRPRHGERLPCRVLEEGVRQTTEHFQGQGCRRAINTTALSRLLAAGRSVLSNTRRRHVSFRGRVGRITTARKRPRRACCGTCPSKMAAAKEASRAIARARLCVPTIRPMAYG